MTTRLGVAVVGFGWMGRVHAQAYARLPHHYPDLALRARLVAVADAELVQTAGAAGRYGFERVTADWRELVDDPDIQAVSVAAPNYLHAEIGATLAAAGKHIWIEKPVGRTVADARAVAQAVGAAGVQSTVGFNYRNVPAVARARALIDAGRIGAITHARFRLFSDYAAHPAGGLSWRFERDRGGNGVLGDLVSHGVDLARFLVGAPRSLVADTAVFIPARSRPTATGPTGTGSHYALAEGGELGEVENEDYLGCLVRCGNGARLTLEASRISVGEQCNYGFEIHGTRGALFWDFRRMGELGVALGPTQDQAGHDQAGQHQAYQNQYVTTEFVGPEHGEYAAFQPGAGLAMSYDDLKVIEAANFLRSIADGKPHGATIADAVHSAVALAAMEASARTGGWVQVGQ